MKKSLSTVKLYLDIFFFILMVIVLIPQTSGIPIHEWVGFIILIPFLFHLVINWDWIASNTSGFFRKDSNTKRFDFILNWMLYLSMLVVTVSGIVISEAALPVFGIHFQPDRFWSVIHSFSATLLMALLGIHIALHWKWIVGIFRKLKFKSDLHHLTEITQIARKYSRQLIFLLVSSIFFSLFIWIFNYSEWADSFRVNSIVPDGDQHKKLTESWMIYFLPLLKVAIIITIPALITGAILRIKQLVNKAVLPKNTNT